MNIPRLNGIINGVEAEVGAVSFDERRAPDVGADEAVGLRYPFSAQQGVAQWTFHQRDETGIRQIRPRIDLRKGHRPL